MLSYEECKKIALEYAEYHNVVLDKAYSLGNGFIFDDSKNEYEGPFPVVVDAITGDIYGLWRYLNEKNLYLDNMKEHEF